MRMILLTLTAALVGAGCTLPSQEGGTFREPDQIKIFRAGPEDAPEGTCWGQDESPAVVETVTVQVVERPAQLDAAGQVIEPARLRTEQRQRIVQSREAVWFETPCPEVFTSDFVESLQRGLALRDIYLGPAHGEMDRATRDAIRVFQKPMGLNSPVLSMVAARKLGLVAYSRDDIKRF